MIAIYTLRKDDMIKQAETAYKAINNEVGGKWERWSTDFKATDRKSIGLVFDRTEAELLYQEVIDEPCLVEGTAVPKVTPGQTTAQLFEAKIQSNVLSSMQQFTQLRYQSRIFTFSSNISMRRGSTQTTIPYWYDKYITSWEDAKSKADQYYTRKGKPGAAGLSVPQAPSIPQVPEVVGG